jgi:TPR repeat protein
VNDAGAIYVLGNCYHHGDHGLQQDQAKALELWKQAAELGSSMAHYNLGAYYYEGGDLKKAKFHYEAAAIAGHEVARFNLGCIEAASGKIERAVKHWAIAASAGNHAAMHALRTNVENGFVMHTLLIEFGRGLVSRDVIDSTLTTYNNSCTEMRSEARDAYIRFEMSTI